MESITFTRLYAFFVIDVERRRMHLVATAPAECLDWILIRKVTHLHQVLTIFAGHDNTVRPHRSLDLHPPITPAAVTRDRGSGRIVRRNRLGGLIHEYRRAA